MNRVGRTKAIIYPQSAAGDMSESPSKAAPHKQYPSLLPRQPLRISSFKISEGDDGEHMSAFSLESCSDSDSDETDDYGGRPTQQVTSKVESILAKAKDRISFAHLKLKCFDGST